MTCKEELLLCFDQVAEHPEESVALALKGVTEEESWYQHPAYSMEEREAEHPPSGSILWYVVHLADCYTWYKALILTRPERPDYLPVPEIKNLSDGIATMKSCRADLRECFATLQDEAFEDLLSNGRSISDQLRMIIRHDAWHGGQIAVAKRLARYK